MTSFDENGKYIKTNWKAGDKITATKLNKIEESIEAVNDNDISRHVEADARLDALEAKDVAHDEELTDIKNAIADNKAAAELSDYDINSRMTFLENELNEGIEEVHNVAETVDGKIATAEANMTAQVDQGKADMEAMVAEVEADLEGLHAKDEELSAQLAHNERGQIDYVEIANSLCKINKKYFKVLDNRYEIVCDVGNNRHLTYSIRKDDIDDYFKIGKCFIGNLNESQSKLKEAINVEDSDCTFVPLGTNTNRYTTTIDQTFTKTVTGEDIYLCHYADNRGGMWEFTIDDKLDKYYVSTYSDSAIYEKVSLIVSGLSNEKHTVVGKFIGQDEQHPTSSPRGWYFYGIDGINKTLIGKETGTSIENSVEKILIADGSNKEFAMAVSNSGLTNWLPQHYDIPSMTKIEDNIVMLDGKIQNLKLYDVVEFNNFKMIQKMTGRNVEADINVFDIQCVYTFDKTIEYDITAKCINDTEILLYPLMLPSGDRRLLDCAITGFGNSVDNKKDESYTYFADEKDNCYSVAFLSDVNTDLIACGTLKYPYLSYRKCKSMKGNLSENLMLWNRDLNPKFYFKSCENLNIYKGQCLNWGGKIAIGEIEYIYNIKNNI